jgi:hypothetical protein
VEEHDDRENLGRMKTDACFIYIVEIIVNIIDKVILKLYGTLIYYTRYVPVRCHDV